MPSAEVQVQEQPQPIIHPIYEPQTSTYQYIIADPSTKNAIIIDPVLDFDPLKNTISTKTADSLLNLIKSNNYTVLKILETHVHADHLTASKYLQSQLKSLQSSTGIVPQICIGKRIDQVQERFARRYGIPRSEYEEAFDKLLDDDEVFYVGDLKVTALHLPGHTPDHLGYLVGDNVFCGDSLFNGDVGSARCDFPGGDAQALYASAQRLFALPSTHKIYTGHNYPPGPSSSSSSNAGGRTEPVPYTTVGEQKSTNKHLKTGTSEADFVNWRTSRDQLLAEPRLIHQALQFNIRAGRLPPLTDFQERMLRVPVKIEGGKMW